MYPIAILRDGPQYRKLSPRPNANYSKAKLNSRFFLTYSTWQAFYKHCMHAYIVDMTKKWGVRYQYIY